MTTRTATATTVKLFVGGLSWDTTEQMLRDAFGHYGGLADVVSGPRRGFGAAPPCPVLAPRARKGALLTPLAPPPPSSQVVMRDKSTGKPRGFGFVTMADGDSAKQACADKHTIDGRVVEAKVSVPPGEAGREAGRGGRGGAAAQNRKIFVGGLSPDTRDDDFRQYFEQFGEIVESQIMQDHMTGRSRGFGFITYTSDASVQNVFSEGRHHEIKGKQVEVKTATPRKPDAHKHSRGRGGRRGDALGGGGAGAPTSQLPYGVADPSGLGYVPFGVPGYYGVPGMYPPAMQQLPPTQGGFSPGTYGSPGSYPYVYEFSQAQYIPPVNFDPAAAADGQAGAGPPNQIPLGSPPAYPGFAAPLPLVGSGGPSPDQAAPTQNAVPSSRRPATGTERRTA